MALKFGFWTIRGLGQPIRLLLKYTGTDFEEISYQQGGPPEFSRQEWFSAIPKLGLDFPNLPYLIDGDFKLTQSNAILRYIARKHGLCGRTERQMAIVDMLENEAMDFRNEFVQLVYDPNMASMKADYLHSVDARIQRFSLYLGDKPWFTGDEITFPDFSLYELFDQHRLFEPTILDKYPNLKNFLDRFEALPAIKAYLSSDQFKKRPVYNTPALWK